MSPDSKKFQDSLSKESQLRVHLEEYRALRAEQRRKMGNQQNITYLLVLLLAAILGVVTSIFSTDYSKITKEQLSFILLLTPIFTSALVFLYLDNDIMIFRIGKYISDNLREKVTQLTSNKNLWEWDIYHKSESQKRFFTIGITSFFSRSILISSILIPLIIFFVFVPSYKPLQIGLSVLDITLLLLVVDGSIYIGRYFFKPDTEQSNRLLIIFTIITLFMKPIKALIKKYEFLRAQKISQLCKGFIKPRENVLDVGSGTGYIAKQVQKNYGVKITCVDIVDYSQVSLPLFLYDGENLPFRKNTFDVVLLAFVLHHSDNPSNLLKEAKRVLRQEGSIIIFEDIYTNWLRYLITLVMDFFLNLPYRVKTPFTFKRESEWILIFKQLNLQIQHKKFVQINRFDPVKHILFVLNKK